MRKSKVTGAFKPTSLIMPILDIVLLLNIVLYGIKTHSVRQTAALVLCDPAFIWALFGTAIIVL